MDLKSSLALAVLVTLAALVTTGDGLKCEQCTSYEHTKCGDPFHHEDGTVKTTEFLEECPAPEQGKPAYDMCRKIYQNGKFPKN